MIFDKGFWMVCVNVVVREGCWYWECKVICGILKKKNEGDLEFYGYICFGFVCREVFFDVLVGFDVYSYGIWDKFG